MSALGADLLWDLGGVAPLHLDHGPFFVHEAVAGRSSDRSPLDVALTTTRIERFVDDPGGLIERAVAARATAVEALGDHQVPWGVRRQGGFHRSIRPSLVGRRPVAACSALAIAGQWRYVRPSDGRYEGGTETRTVRQSAPALATAGDRFGWASRWWWEPASSMRGRRPRQPLWSRPVASASRFLLDLDQALDAGCASDRASTAMPSRANANATIVPIACNAVTWSVS